MNVSASVKAVLSICVFLMEKPEDIQRKFKRAITDSDTQQVLTVGRGQIMQADVVDVRKGEAGFPGELKGSFLRENRVLGDIFVNNQYGIYGELEEIPEHPLYPDGVPIGRRDAVHTGPATILSTVGTDGMREYDVEIVEVARQSQPAQRSMVLRVTDPELLERRKRRRKLGRRIFAGVVAAAMILLLVWVVLLETQPMKVEVTERLIIYEEREGPDET